MKEKINFYENIVFSSPHLIKSVKPTLLFLDYDLACHLESGIGATVYYEVSLLSYITGNYFAVFNVKDSRGHVSWHLFNF